MEINSHRYISKLASLRFFAALLVVIFHMGGVIESHPGFVASIINPISAYGYVGVSVFFVLSGFVISLANERWKGWRIYLAGRITRIYPPHLIVTLTLFITDVVALISLHSPHGWVILLSNLALVQALNSHPDVFNSMNVVTWSLSVEMFFYVAFIGLRNLGDRLLFALTATAYILLLGYTLHLHTHHKWTFDIFWKLYVNPVARLPEFLTGMSIYRLYRNGKLPKPWMPQFNFPIIFAAMLICMHLVGIYGHMGGSNAEILDYSIVPLPFIALLIVALLDERSSSWMNHRSLVFLGEASFALYLLHRVLIHFLSEIPGMSNSDSLFAATAGLTLFVVVPVIASVLFYKFVEIPVTRNLRLLFTSKPT